MGMSGNKRRHRTRKKSKKKKTPGLKEVYTKISKEVELYGAKLLTGKKRKQWEDEYLQKKGVQKKTPGVSFPMYKKIKAKAKRREDHLASTNEVIDPLQALWKPKKSKKKKPRESSGNILEPQKGTHKGGFIHYSGRARKSVTKRK